MIMRKLLSFVGCWLRSIIVCWRLMSLSCNFLRKYCVLIAWERIIISVCRLIETCTDGCSHSLTIWCNITISICFIKRIHTQNNINNYIFAILNSYNFMKLLFKTEKSLGKHTLWNFTLHSINNGVWRLFNLFMIIALVTYVRCYFIFSFWQTHGYVFYF